MCTDVRTTLRFHIIKELYNQLVIQYLDSIQQLTILGVAGSMRADSYSTKALKMALDLAKKHGAEVRLLELNKTALPLRDPSATTSTGGGSNQGSRVG